MSNHTNVKIYDCGSQNLISKIKAKKPGFKPQTRFLRIWRHLFLFIFGISPVGADFEA